MELYAARESMVHALLAQRMTGPVGTLLMNFCPTGTSENTGIPMSDDENPESMADTCSFANVGSSCRKYGSIQALADDLDWFSGT